MSIQNSKNTAAVQSFPTLLVMRWVVGAALILHGLYAVYILSQSWGVMSDRAIINPEWSPYRYLPAGLLKIATGVLLLLRSKFVAVTLLAWIGAFSYLFLGSLTWRELPPQLFFSWMEQLLLVAFVARLWLKRRLR